VRAAEGDTGLHAACRVGCARRGRGENEITRECAGDLPQLRYGQHVGVAVGMQQDLDGQDVRAGGGDVAGGGRVEEAGNVDVLVGRGLHVAGLFLVASEFHVGELGAFSLAISTPLR